MNVYYKKRSDKYGLGMETAVEFYKGYYEVGGLHRGYEVQVFIDQDDVLKWFGRLDKVGRASFMREIAEANLDKLKKEGSN